MLYLTRDRETGTVIDEFSSRAEAEKAIEKYEETDRAEDIYQPDFYEVAEVAKTGLEELRLDLNTGDYGEYFVDWTGYSDGKYISDVICEIADNHTSIYYSDIMNFISQNPEALVDVIDEGLYDPSNGYDLYKHGQAAEYMTIENDIYSHLADSLMLFALKYTEEYYKKEISDGFIDDDLIKQLEDAISENPNKFDEITEVIDEYFTEEDEEE